MEMGRAATLNTRDVAAVLGVSEKTVLKMVREGRISTLDLGIRRNIFSVSEVARVAGTRLAPFDISNHDSPASAAGEGPGVESFPHGSPGSTTDEESP
jgi:excisionase family DNA binding protein